MALSALGHVLSIVLVVAFMVRDGDSVLYPCYEDDEYSIVRSGRKDWYMLKKKEKSYHRFPDRYTINYYGCNVMIYPLHSDLYGYDRGDLIPSLWDHHANAKMIQYAANARYMQPPKKVIDVLNPSFTIWKNSLVMSYRKEEHKVRVVWFPMSSIKSGKKMYLEISKYFKHFDEYVADPSLAVSLDIDNAEDPRLLSIASPTKSFDEKLFVAYASRYPKKKPEIKMDYAQLFPSAGGINLTDIIKVDFGNEFPQQDQKNWSPFQYEDQLLFVQSVIPHRVVVCDIEQGRSWIAQGRTVGLSEIPGPSYRWDFGELRGGSPAVRITLPSGEGGEDDTFYLTFFHSSNEPPMTGHDMLRTYVMGAYIFEAKPPFAIRAISDVPIVNQNMYTGPWTNLPFSLYHIDYVVFPTALVADVPSDTLILMYGGQDKEGYLTKMSLSGLLKSLKPVQSTVLKTTNKIKSTLI
jgi:predicted GH43/DUF377 family glycosyl hydrolase